MNALHLVAVLIAATVCGLAAQWLNVPGGLILGSMVGAAGVTLALETSLTMPRPLGAAAFIVIGASIGVQVTRSALGQLGGVLVPAVLAGALIIVAGLGIAYLLRGMGIAPPGDVLATSPGALSVMSAMAVEQGQGAVQVALFHLVRVVMVILSLPLLVHFLRGTT